MIFLVYLGKDSDNVAMQRAISSRLAEQGMKWFIICIIYVHFNLSLIFFSLFFLILLYFISKLNFTFIAKVHVACNFASSIYWLKGLKRKFVLQLINVFACLKHDIMNVLHVYFSTINTTATKKEDEFLQAYIFWKKT